VLTVEEIGMETESSFIGYSVLIAIILAIAMPILAFFQHRKKIKELQRRGTRITALITRVEKMTINIGVIGGPIFPDTNYKIYALRRNPHIYKIHIFTSVCRPIEHQELSEGSLVNILIDPDDLRRYDMEL